MRYVVGLDCGGTFTDCVVIDERGAITSDKAFSTPRNLTLGAIGSLENCAQRLGTPLSALLNETTALAVGTTSLTNRVVTGTGARVGLITTSGHEDAILIGRVAQKTDGLSEAEKGDMIRWEKARPLVPKPLIKGVTERVDYKGAVIVPLDEAEARAAIRELLEAGVEAIAVALLWSFMNPAHERRVRELVSEEAKAPLFVTLSSEIAPVLGEYERTATAALNASLGPAAAQDFAGLAESLAEAGFQRSFLVMQSTGGVVWAEEAAQKPVFALSSGPVGGIAGSLLLGKLLGVENLITTDMGGTSFDVGLMEGGVPQRSKTPVYGRYRTLIPAVEVVSIGAGGGSIAAIDPLTGAMRVGPASAGSRPGPVCYGWSGEEPTVTDADLLLGRLNPDNFFGGRKGLDRAGARAVMEEKLARPLGMDVMTVAKGIVDIVDGHMADLIRKTTIERGYDPRQFVLLSFGGCGPGHVGAFARDVGVSRAIIPAQASVFSALGIASSDLVRFYTRSHPLRLPVPASVINGIFEEIEVQARGDLRRTDVSPDSAVLERFVEMQFRYQVHQVRVPVPLRELSDADVEDLARRFTAMYEQIFGAGTAFREAGIEMVTFGALATVRLTRPILPRQPPASRDPSHALKGHRKVYFGEDFVDAPVYDGSSLESGNVLEGPAVIEGPSSTPIIHPGQKATIDEFLNIVLEL